MIRMLIFLLVEYYFFTVWNTSFFAIPVRRLRFQVACTDANVRTSCIHLLEVLIVMRQASRGVCMTEFWGDVLLSLASKL